MPETTLFTIGHSNRNLGELLAMLHERGVRQLADVRSLPRSRRHPCFDHAPLSVACAEAGIAYLWLGQALGGLRHERGESRHCALTSSGFRAYADHMESRDFSAGLARLATLAGAEPTAIMCAEREPEQCHRAMIADLLLLRGWQIIHLIGPQRARHHRINPLARDENGAPVYDVLSRQQLSLGF